MAGANLAASWSKLSNGKKAAVVGGGTVLTFLGYRWWKNRQAASNTTTASASPADTTAPTTDTGTVGSSGGGFSGGGGGSGDFQSKIAALVAKDVAGASSNASTGGTPSTVTTQAGNVVPASWGSAPGTLLDPSSATAAQAVASGVSGVFQGQSVGQNNNQQTYTDPSNGVTYNYTGGFANGTPTDRNGVPINLQQLANVAGTGVTTSASVGTNAVSAK